jgi:hypothetical protein
MKGSITKLTDYERQHIKDLEKRYLKLEAKVLDGVSQRTEDKYLTEMEIIQCTIARICSAARKR